MGKNSKIEWTTHTQNFWIGCTKVGPGCDHCYAENQDVRWGHKSWGSGAPRRRTSERIWKQPTGWNRIAANTGERPWVFCSSLSDFFDNEVPPEWRADAWETIRRSPNLNWQIVTKRISNVAKMVPPDWPLPHVGIIATVCTQDEANRDIPRLLNTPARWRGLSVEPMLGPISIPWSMRTNLDWIVIGGESGSSARAFNVGWARDLIGECRASDTPVFMKQLGRKVVYGTVPWRPKNEGRDMEEWPVDIRIRQMPRVEFQAPEKPGAPV